MYWSSALRFLPITERFKRDRFYKLSQSIKVVIDDDIPEDLRECDKFWKVRLFLDCILKGCSEAQSSWHENFVCASVEGIMLDFELYQGADALIAQVEEPGELGLGGLVIDRQKLSILPEDTCQRWDKKQKQYVSIRRPSIVREYNNKMGGVDLTDRMISYYRMSVHTK
ncbi:hypothetical protein QTP70_030591, partial [Hemibagrus guttatus]